jgi:CTP:molybdopterin cytidylyltransferase MocA
MTDVPPDGAGAQAGVRTGARVAGLLLAAGAGRRFGRPKALVEIGGEPLAARGARTLADGGCGPIVVVLGARADQVLAAGVLPRAARAVVATTWKIGLGASLRAGLAALEGEPDVAAVVVALADQPLVGPDAVRRLIAAYRPIAAGPGASCALSCPSTVAAPTVRAAVATYDGARRNPVLLSREVWRDVADAARGDLGARGWLRSRPDLVTPVDCDGTGLPDDVDTPADLVRVSRLLGGPPPPPRTDHEAGR